MSPCKGQPNRPTYSEAGPAFLQFHLFFSWWVIGDPSSSKKHLNIPIFEVIEGDRAVPLRKGLPGIRCFFNSRGLALDLKSLRIRRADRHAGRDDVVALPGQAAVAAEEEQPR